jgi:hypothetical protein
MHLEGLTPENAAKLSALVQRFTGGIARERAFRERVRAIVREEIGIYLQQQERRYAAIEHRPELCEK